MRSRFAHITFRGLLLSLGLVGAAHAALLPRLDGKAVYDTDLNITWIADANLPASQAFGLPFIGADGVVYNFEVLDWLQGMNAADGTGYLGFGDWRLPDGVPDGAQVDAGATELGHLFQAELGATPGESVHTSGDPDLALFSNIGVEDAYWFDAHDGDPETRYDHWVFSFADGSAYLDGFTEGGNGYLIWPVRNGDVLAIPVPHSVLLFGSSLVGLVAVSRRRTRR